MRAIRYLAYTYRENDQHEGSAFGHHAAKSAIFIEKRGHRSQRPVGRRLQGFACLWSSRRAPV